jgi:hypothetical protein
VRRASSLVVTLTLALGSALGLTSCSSAPSPKQALLSRLLSAQVVHQLGFTEVLNKPKYITQTGSTACTAGVKATWENPARYIGLLDQVISCKSVPAALDELKTLETSFPASVSVGPPGQLGRTATYSDAQAPLFVFIWSRGTFVALVGFDTDATDNPRESILNRARPLAPVFRNILDRAATRQNAQIG